MTSPNEFDNVAGYSGDHSNTEDTSDIDAMFTTSKELMDIKPYDKTVEIIGYVDYIVPSKNVRQNELRVFKFVLNNGDRQRIQVNAWNAEISRTESVIKLNAIVHLDSAFAKICTKQAFNDGTVNTELIIESYTVINVLGQRNTKLSAEISEMAPIVTLDKIENTTKYCRLEGYIKSNFYLLRRQNGRGINFGCGSMTNGSLKVEVHVQNFKENHDFYKGDHITAYGYLKRHANPTYFDINSMADVKLVDAEQMKFENLLQGFRTLKVNRSARV